MFSSSQHILAYSTATQSLSQKRNLMPVKLMQNYKLKKVKISIHAHTVLATGRDPLPHALKWKEKLQQHVHSSDNVMLQTAAVIYFINNTLHGSELYDEPQK